MTCHLLIGQLLFGHPRGLPRIFDRGVGVAGRRALTIVVCDFSKGLPRCIKTAYCFRDDVMQSAPLRRRQCVVERLSDQRVAEAVASRRAMERVDEFKRSSLIEKIGQGLTGRLAGGFQGVESEIAPDDRGQIENVASVFRQRLDKASGKLQDAARNRQSCRHVQRVACQSPLGGHVPKDLAQKERVAFCHIVQPADQ
jgi:hypothetical protein